MSDILLLIVDARYPSALVPPSLINGVHPKPVILVLNKVDLVPPELAAAWKNYFEKKFTNVNVTYFTSCPAYNLLMASGDSSRFFRKLRGKISMAKEGALQIYQLVQQIVGDEVDLSSWKEKIDNFSLEEGCEETPVKDSSLTLGMIGYPNAGKSSLINSLVGRRVVSVSKTPGHTKHFQTIFISHAVRLCDCPGLVFPSTVPRPFQVVLGSFPISQTREPYSVVQLLAERLDLPSILKLEQKADKWTTYDLCEAWAYKRGYVTARSNRPDIARAANHIMRMALEGKLTLCLRPPGYRKADWQGHPDTVIIKDLLALDKIGGEIIEEEIKEESDSDSEQSVIEEEEEALTVAKNKFSVLDVE